MPKEEKEFAIVPKPGSEAEPPPLGLRIMKTVKMSNDSTYLIPVPDLIDSGLHFSFHPTGEIHLKDRDEGVIARINLRDVTPALFDGKLERLLSTFLQPPKAGKAAEGVIVPAKVFEQLGSVGSIAKGADDVVLVADELVGALDKVEIEDTGRLAVSLAWLRAQGYLKGRALLMLNVDGSKRATVFMNVFDTPPRANPAPNLPVGMPMKGLVEQLFTQLSTYGGFFVNIPDESEWADLAQSAGLGDFYEALKKFGERLDGSDVESRIAALMPGIEAMFGSAIQAIIGRPTLRPDQANKPPADKGPEASTP
jgi:hypothetical protein